MLASFRDGSRVSAAYVIGADGGWSTVRKLIGAKFSGRTREDQLMYLGDLVVTGMPRLEDVTSLWYGSDGTVALAVPVQRPAGRPVPGRAGVPRRRRGARPPACRRAGG